MSWMSSAGALRQRYKRRDVRVNDDRKRRVRRRRKSVWRRAVVRRERFRSVVLRAARVLVAFWWEG